MPTFVKKTWAANDEVNSTELNRMENGIQTGGAIISLNASMPAATTVPAGQMALVTDNDPGDMRVFSDGTNWRRAADESIIVLPTPPTYSTYVLSHPSVDLYLPMEETSGTTLQDATANNRDGALSGTYTLNAAGPQGDAAVAFNGGQALVANYGNRLVYAMEIWVYIDADASGYDAFMDRSGFQAYVLREDGTDELWRWDAFDTNHVLTRQAWHHIVYATDNASEILWVDGGGAGKKFVRNVAPPAIADAHYYIGANDGGIHPMKGRACRFAIYNAVPSDQDVADRWTAGTA